MVPYSLLSAVLDLISLASTVTVIIWLVSSLQPRFERARDSCRACQPIEGRALLLWSAFLIPIAWVAAAALYFRNLSSLWQLMGTCLDNQPVNRPAYALLHLYLFFLLVCGIYACAITVFEIFQHRKVFIDLLMIARFDTRKYQAIEDLEAQLLSSSTNSTDPEAGNPSVIGNVRNTSLLPQAENSRGNGQESNEDVAPAEARISESGRLTEEAAWPRIDRPVGDVITQNVCSPIWNRSAKWPCWPIGGEWNNSQAAGPSYRHCAALDSDGDAITMTPSSSSSSCSSSGIDELEYVDDDYDRYGRQGVRLREPLEKRKSRNTKASHTFDRRGQVGEDDDSDDDDDDEDPYNLYYATPRLGPQDQNPRTDIEPLDLGEPPSPCDSCSSAHADSIPTARRSPARVPITPTSPTAAAEDADTEKTDVERKRRERKSRNAAMSAPQIPHANRSSRLPPYDTNTFLFGIDPNQGSSEEYIKALESNLAAYAQEQRARATASTHTSSKPKPKASPTSAPALYTHPAFEPPGQRDREAGLFWRSHEAENSRSPASRKASVVSFDPRITIDTRSGMRRRVEAPSRSPRRKRPGSPYPLAGGRQPREREGGKGPRDLSLEIPDKGVDSNKREDGQ